MGSSVLRENNRGESLDDIYKRMGIQPSKPDDVVVIKAATASPLPEKITLTQMFGGRANRIRRDAAAKAAVDSRKFRDD